MLPVRNGARHLSACLEAIARQRRQPDEVWIVVAPSTDATCSIANSAASNTPRMRVAANPRGDRATALNLVIGQTSADALAFVDAQAHLAPDYLAAAEQVLVESGAAVVGGPMRPVGNTPVGRAMATALQSQFGVGDSRFHFAGAARDVGSVYLGVYRTEVFDRIGRYNTALLRTEDDDLNARVRQAGMRIRLDPTIWSTYRCRDTLREIWQQYFGYGFWKVALGSIRPGSIRLRHAMPAAFVTVLAISGVLAIAGWWLLLAAVAAAWLAAATLAAVTAPASGIITRLLFPVVALTMHVAYGLGTLAGFLSIGRLRTIALEGAKRVESAR